MTKFLLIGSNGTLGTEFEQIIPKEQLIVGNRPQIDITDFVTTNAFILEHAPEVVINCAAYTNVDGAESDYETAYAINAQAVQNLAKACASINATLVHFSTGMVFAGTDESGSNEDDNTNPVNKYGESKRAGEKAIQSELPHHYIVRTEWLYGKPKTEAAKKSFVEMVIELGKSGTVKGVIDEIGRPTWTKDVAEATLALIHSRSRFGIYHIANEGQASRLAWAQEIYKILGMGVLSLPVTSSDFPRPAKRPKYELINNTKLPKLRTWQEALTEYLNS